MVTIASIIKVYFSVVYHSVYWQQMLGHGLHSKKKKMYSYSVQSYKLNQLGTGSSTYTGCNGNNAKIRKL